MSAAEIIQAARWDGVGITLSSVGTLKAAGEQTAVNRWRSILVEHKAEIVTHLMDDEAERRWLPGWPGTCSCGTKTGWFSGGEPRCPNCEFDHLRHRGVQ